MFASILPSPTTSFAGLRCKSIEARSNAKGALQQNILSRAEAVSLYALSGLDSGLHLLSACAKLPVALVKPLLNRVSPNLLGDRVSFGQIGQHLAMACRSILALFLDIPRIVIRPDLATSYYIQRGICSPQHTINNLLAHAWKVRATATGLAIGLTAALVFSQSPSTIPFKSSNLMGWGFAAVGSIILLAGLCLCCRARKPVSLPRTEKPVEKERATHTEPEASAGGTSSARSKTKAASAQQSSKANTDAPDTVWSVNPLSSPQPQAKLPEPATTTSKKQLCFKSPSSPPAFTTSKMRVKPTKAIQQIQGLVAIFTEQLNNSSNSEELIAQNNKVEPLFKEFKAAQKALGASKNTKTETKYKQCKFDLYKALAIADSDYANSDALHRGMTGSALEALRKCLQTLVNEKQPGLSEASSNSTAVSSSVSSNALQSRGDQIATTKSRVDQLRREDPHLSDSSEYVAVKSRMADMAQV